MKSLLTAVITGRHSELAPYRSTLAWFANAIEIDAATFGAANDNRQPVPRVPDARLGPDNSYVLRLLRALPEPSRTYTRCLRKSGRQAGPVQRFVDWGRDNSLPKGKWGALRFATNEYKDVQFILVKGDEEARYFDITAGALTHVWGTKVEQQVGSTKLSQATAAVEERRKTLDWLCRELGAIPSSNPKKTMRRRKKQPPIDWAAWPSLHGNVPLAVARASVGLPPRDALPDGLPYGTEPIRLFRGLVTGQGSRADGSKEPSRVRRHDPEIYTAHDAATERLALDEFKKSQPENYKTLMSAAAVRSMSALVPSNDNATGKRRLSGAAGALQNFLAA